MLDHYTMFKLTLTEAKIKVDLSDHSRTISFTQSIGHHMK